MLKIKIFIMLLAMTWLGLASSQAQEVDLNGFNEMSVSFRQVHKFDQMYKRTLWFRLDLKEKQNKHFFANGNEVTKIIIESVKAGIIRPFENDSLTERMSYEKFIKNLTVRGSEPVEGEDTGGGDWGGDAGGGTGGGGTGGGGTGGGTGGGDGWGGGGDAGAGGGGGDGGGEEGTSGGGTSDSGDGSAETTTAATNEHFPQQLDILELKEDLIFDKKRSRMIHDIQAIGIKIPAKLHPAGLEEALAWFSYKELVEQVFKDNPHAIWYNNDNLAEHRNFGEAFEMRLFSAHLFKYANWDDAMISEMYGGEGKGAILAAQQIEFELIDFEQDLWEN